MMVTFVSQCEKNALKKTRRVLDAFANRIGDNVWQTIITQEGLNAVKKLLRRTASKNTAVSCHWLRSRSRSELVWMVGNKSRFNKQGLVPVNKTRRVLLNNEWESGWSMATSIQILATLAALFHDLGKATIGFQKKLLDKGKLQADPYRHEWISLRLFEAMIKGCDTDQAWLERLINSAELNDQHQEWEKNLYNDSKEKPKGFAHLPPLARMVVWLIVTHHRMPFDGSSDFNKKNVRENLQHKTRFLTSDLDRFYKRLFPFDGWVLSQKACDERKAEISRFWTFAGNVTQSRTWQGLVKRWANKALNHPPLLNLPSVNNPLLMHLSRLCLMVGDHNYSSLAADDKRRVAGDAALKTQLLANTCRASGEPKQSLDEHLMGVAKFASAFARLLPRFYDELPHLEDQPVFKKRTNNARFQWQNQAWSLARKYQSETRQSGFFGVNMASTGCGKTLGNARIMAALADPDKGPRFTIAMGLRVLTLQTGLALRERLGLDETALAILVGGTASRALFELQQDDKDNTGSESESPLIDEQVDYEDCALDQSVLGTIIQDKKAKDLLYAPLVSCTVDHLMGATETLRGGRHIVPMLRLLTGDLILDEPDDFDQNDLPALSRLVFMAGMLGSRVLLSSATLTPDLIAGLFNAYQQGRTHWQCNQGEQQGNIYCGWFDEFNQDIAPCADKAAFELKHQQFVKKRVKKLAALPARRVGEVLPVNLPAPIEGEKLNNEALASILVSASHHLHQRYHQLCPDTKKTASVGLVRVAHINAMFDLALALYQAPLPDDVQIHLCCYHARQLLVLRSQLERKLDRILDRNTSPSLFDHKEIRDAVNASPKRHHIFIVLGTSVTEVGRDHDYDWAIVEPSSMRSIIQLVGRVWRHRPDKTPDGANVLILDKNIRSLKVSGSSVGQPVFTQPGFESPRHLLDSHACSELISTQQLSNIDARPRIARAETLQPANQLADLEHAVMADLLNPSSVNAVTAFWQPNTAMQANVHLQRVTPFRHSPIKDNEFVAFPDADQPAGIRFRYSEEAWKEPGKDDNENSLLRYTRFLPEKTTVTPWLVEALSDALDYLAERLPNESEQRLAMKFATVRLDELRDDKSWCFHPWFGFWLRR